MLNKLFKMFKSLSSASLATLLFLGAAACQSEPPAGHKSTDLSALPYPVMEEFADLEPILHYQTDTTYVINFWATWCKPCVEELPYFEQLHSEIAGKKVKIILVSLDFKKDIPTKLLQFVRDNHIQSDVIALADGRYNDWIEKVDPEWGGAIPITLVYGPKGRVFQPEQFASYEELKTMVLGLL